MAGIQGIQQNGTALSPRLVDDFRIKTAQAGMWTSTLVKVIAVSNSGGLAPSGTVDIMPLVNQIDGSGSAQPHGIIFACPYSRLQGGSFAIVMDPAPGDIGIAVFASRDISSVQATKKQANPGSRRQFDPSDGLYVGGCLNGVPSTFIQFNGSGVTITSPNGVTINGNLAVTGSVTAGSGGGDSVTLQGHKHGTGTAAAGTVAPTAGT
jgi:hypothetical protein